MAVTISDTSTLFSTLGGNPLLNNLVAYWNLNESSGGFNESVGNNDGTLVNSVTYVSAKIGNGLYFDTLEERGTIAASESLYHGGTEISISLWFYMDTLPSVTGRRYRPITLKSGASSVIGIYILNTNDRVYFYVNDVSAVLDQVINPSAISAGQWYHVVGVCSGTSTALKLYLNGSDVSTSAGTPADLIAEPVSGIDIGGWGTSHTIHGTVDEVGYWKRVLTPTEVTELYNSGSGKAYPFT